MDGLLTLLLFAGLFFVMMKFGCGAHMMHGHSGHKKDKRSGSETHTDPVCGKSVPPIQGYGKMQEGHLYRFCSRECLDIFDANSNQYVNNAPRITSEHGTTH